MKEIMSTTTARKNNTKSINIKRLNLNSRSSRIVINFKKSININSTRKNYIYNRVG